MSTDRELTKFAAKAAGLWDAENDCVDIPWLPLVNDGDALRLAVKLNMTLAVGVARSDAGEFTEFELCNHDVQAATRRAIVRAAAEIGKAMP